MRGPAHYPSTARGERWHPAARLFRLGTRLLAVAAIAVGATIGAAGAAGVEEPVVEEQAATVDEVDAPATAEPSETSATVETDEPTDTGLPHGVMKKDHVPPGLTTPNASRANGLAQATSASSGAEGSTDPATDDERTAADGASTGAPLPASPGTAGPSSTQPSAQETAPAAQPDEPPALSEGADGAASRPAQDTAVASSEQPTTRTTAHVATGSPGVTLARGGEVALEQHAAAQPVPRTSSPESLTRATVTRSAVATPVRPAASVRPAAVLGAEPVNCGELVPSRDDMDPVAKFHAPVALTTGIAVITPRVTTTVSVAMDFARLSGGWAGPLVFNVWLRRQLRERRLSQRQLGAMASVNHSTISRLVGGTRVPSLETAVKLVHALRMDWTDEQVATYFDLLPEGTLFPTQRVESALRGDPELGDSEVSAIMGTYLTVRSQRRASSRALEREPDATGPPRAGTPTGRR